MYLKDEHLWLSNIKDANKCFDNSDSDDFIVKHPDWWVSYYFGWANIELKRQQKYEHSWLSSLKKNSNIIIGNIHVYDFFKKNVDI